MPDIHPFIQSFIHPIWQPSHLTSAGNFGKVVPVRTCRRTFFAKENGMRRWGLGLGGVALSVVAWAGEPAAKPGMDDALKK